MTLSNLALTILSLLNSISVYASTRQTHTKLKVGDKAPSFQVYKWIKGSPEKTFQKGKVYLVEFGATWCRPCGEAIPHLTEIARKYENRLQVISVFIMEYRKNALDISYVSRVDRYVNKMGSKMDYKVFVDGPQRHMENNWVNAAGLTGIPESFIIDKNGMIAWLGSAPPQTLDQMIELVTADNYQLSDAIEHSKLINTLEGLKIDNSIPMFMNENGGDTKDFIYRSMLTKYKGEQSGNSDFICSTAWAKYNPALYPYPGLVQQIGVSLGNLYYLAYGDTISAMIASRFVDGTANFPDTLKYPTLRNSYGKYWYKAVLELSDSSPFKFNYKTFKNLYNYSLAVTDKNTTAKFLQQAMRHDLETYFGYSVTVQNRMMPCWKVVSSDNGKISLKTKTPGSKYQFKQVNDTLYKISNAIMKDILVMYQYSFSFGYASYDIEPITEAPFIDDSEITNEIDYTLSERERLGFKNHNWDTALEFLHRLGLNLIRDQRETRVVVITDRKSSEN